MSPRSSLVFPEARELLSLRTEKFKWSVSRFGVCSGLSTLSVKNLKYPLTCTSRYFSNHMLSLFQAFGLFTRHSSLRASFRVATYPEYQAFLRGGGRREKGPFPPVRPLSLPPKRLILRLVATPLSEHRAITYYN